MPYLSGASKVMIHYEEVLYQVYAPLPYLYTHIEREERLIYAVIVFNVVECVAGIPQRSLLIVRWSAAIISLALIGPLLGCYGVQSTLLPWISVTVVVYIGLVLALLRKSKVNFWHDFSNYLIVLM